MPQPPRHRRAGDPLALDDASVDRLLTGALPTADAPPGYARVAELLAATVAPPTPRELAGQAAVLAELRAVTRARLAATTGRARPRRHRRRFGLAAVVVAGALATGGAAAAATGHLPEPVRQVAGSILTVPGRGPAIPTPPESSPGTRVAGAGGAGPGASPSAGASGQGPGSTAAGPATGPDLDGLCTAYLAGKGGQQGGKLDATAFRALSAAAGGDDQVLAFCRDRQAAGSKKKDAKPHDPPGGGQGQGGPPASTGGGAGGGQGRPPATSTPPAANPHGSDGAAKAR